MDDDSLLLAIAFSVEDAIAVGPLDDAATWQRVAHDAARALALLDGRMSAGELLTQTTTE